MAFVLIFTLGGVTFSVSAEKIACPWKCTFNDTAEEDNLWDYTEGICIDAFTDGTIGPEIPKGQPAYGGQEWNGLLLGTDWSGWWHNILNYCVERGHWANAMRNGAWPGAFQYGPGNIATFQIASGGPDIVSEDLELDGCNEGSVCIKGRSLQTVTRTMNSPFLYFNDLPDGAYSVRIKSDSKSFNTDPDFNAKNGWDITINNEQREHLFYELETLGVTLSMNGKSFKGDDALFDYLENKDFFTKLGFTETEKQNSLEYIRDNLPSKPYYYLTILDENSIESVSGLEIRDNNESLIEVVRRYFAIYPTRIPVEPNGDLSFPLYTPSSSLIPYVKDYGEIIFKPDMQVFWR